MRDQGQAGIKRMPLAAMSLVTGLRPPLLAGRRTLAGRRRCTGAVAGRRLGGVAAVLIEAVLQLGDAIEELINQLVGLLRVVGIPAECMVFLLMGGAYLRSRIKQAGKWDQETIVSFFLCQYCSGEYLLFVAITDGVILV